MEHIEQTSTDVVVESGCARVNRPELYPPNLWTPSRGGLLALRDLLGSISQVAIRSSGVAVKHDFPHAPQHSPANVRKVGTSEGLAAQGLAEAPPRTDKHPRRSVVETAAVQLLTGKATRLDSRYHCLANPSGLEAP